MAKNFPRFECQPREVTEFSPSIQGWIRALGYSVVCVDGLFDLLVERGGKRNNKYLELKVCLRSQRWAIPISKKQHEFISAKTGMLKDSARVLIYGADEKLYAFCSYLDLADGISAKHNGTTSYVRATGFLNQRLHWYSSREMGRVLKDWLDAA
jgi:hypothetical protein